MRRRALLLLALLALVAGCAAHLHRGPQLGGGLQPVSNGDWAVALGYVGIFLLAGAVLVVAFVVDLLLLPISIDDPDFLFPCCRFFVDLW